MLASTLHAIATGNCLPAGVETFCVDINQAVVTKLADRLQQGPGAYPGFLGVDGAERIGEAYPAGTYERLVAVKRQYDPANLFRSNHNIVP